jgi:hypothetical protein
MLLMKNITKIWKILTGIKYKLRKDAGSYRRKRDKWKKINKMQAKKV